MRADKDPYAHALELMYRRIMERSYSEEWDKYRTIKTGQRISVRLNWDTMVRRHPKGLRSWFSPYDSTDFLENVKVVKKDGFGLSLDIGNRSLEFISPTEGTIVAIDGKAI